MILRFVNNTKHELDVLDAFADYVAHPQSSNPFEKHMICLFRADLEATDRSNYRKCLNICEHIRLKMHEIYHLYANCHHIWYLISLRYCTFTNSLVRRR